MPVTQDPKVPKLPDLYKAKVMEEYDRQKFKGKGESIKFLEPKGVKNKTCNKINIGQGKDVFIKWSGEDLIVIGYTNKHGNGGNKTYEGYIYNSKEQSITIK